MSDNLYDVPKSQWKKWSPLARNVFNQVYFVSFENQKIFTHPRTPNIEKEQWKTVSWNHAWEAAEAVRDNE